MDRVVIKVGSTIMHAAFTCQNEIIYSVNSFCCNPRKDPESIFENLFFFFFFFFFLIIIIIIVIG